MKTVNQLALEVIDGKWGSGEARKKKLTEAGYDYEAVQKRVNEILEVISNMNSWAKKIADSKYHYVTFKRGVNATHTCPICTGRKYDNYYGWNCIGFAWAVWHHGGGIPCKCNCHVISNEIGEKIANAKTDAEALKIAQDHVGIKDIKVIRNNGKDVPKSQWRAGDIGLMFKGKEYKHTFYYMGDGKVADSSNYSDDKKDIAIRGYGNYTARVIIRLTFGEVPMPYGGKLPTLKLIKTNAEVIADAIKFALWIAGDNSFHYGYTDKHGSKDSKKWKPNAHHNGCYFCGTNTDKGGRSKAGIVDYKKTYCCNPFVTAAWAHGGCVPAALKLCRLGSSWTFSKGKGYDASKLFDNLGKPAKKNLKKGYVLCSDTHVALYIGDGKIVEAAHGDDNKKHSESWNSSIRVTTLTDSRYNSFKRVHRFNGSVNTTAYIGFGEVSDRVALLQSFLKWYGFDIASDRYFGEATVKAVQEFQAENGLVVDGKVGAKTLKKMSEVRK